MHALRQFIFHRSLFGDHASTELDRLRLHLRTRLPTLGLYKLAAYFNPDLLPYLDFHAPFSLSLEVDINNPSLRSRIFYHFLRTHNRDTNMRS